MGCRCRREGGGFRHGGCGSFGCQGSLWQGLTPWVPDSIVRGAGMRIQVSWAQRPLGKVKRVQVRGMSLAGLGAGQWVLKVPRVWVLGRVVTRPGRCCVLKRRHLFLRVQHCPDPSSLAAGQQGSGLSWVQCDIPGGQPPTRVLPQPGDTGAAQPAQLGGTGCSWITG